MYGFRFRAELYIYVKNSEILAIAMSIDFMSEEWVGDCAMWKRYV